MIRRLSQDETGSALITALLAAMVMLGLGFALLSIVDTQAKQSDVDRTRDHAFNLTESVLTSEAFVLGRSWPDSVPAGNPQCANAGFGDPLAAATPSSAAAAQLQHNLDSSYDPTVDKAYVGASWKVHLCDDVDPDGAGPVAGGTVWANTLLTNAAWDANGNDKVWVRAESTVRGKTRALVGLVRARSTPALNSRYGLVSGGMSDDLGTTLNTLTNQGVLGGVIDRLLGSTPTVAEDPTPGVSTPNGVTGIRCGALDIKDGSVCVSGTIAAVGALPIVSDLVTDGSIENFPNTTATSADNIARLRAQARSAGTYTAVSAGTAPAGSGSLLNPNDTAPSSVAACTLTGSPGASSVVFIEQVGAGTPGTAGGPGDQYCSINVATAVQFRAIVVGMGRIVIRGNNTTTAATDTTVNTFKGVVYALNLQRLSVAAGGAGLGDGAAPGREVLRIDRGAHVRGGVSADGKSGKVGIYPPPISLNTSALVCTLVGCPSLLATTLQALGVTNLLDTLVNGGCLLQLGPICTLSLGGLPVLNVVNAIVGQVQPQRVSYGSAITSNIEAINALTVYGASNVVPGTFRDLQPR